MQNLANRLKDLRRKMGVTQEQLSKELGITRGFLSQLESTKMKKPVFAGPNTVQRLEQLERRHHAKSLAVERPNYAISPSNKPEVQLVHRSRTSRKIPVYSFVQAGQATDFQSMPESWEDEIEYDGSDPNAFALRVAGDSMEPKFPAGTILTIDARYPPSNGQHVVASIKNEGVVFKMFHHTGDGKQITLTSYNPIYPPLLIPREHFHWIYRAVDARVKLS